MLFIIKDLWSSILFNYYSYTKKLEFWLFIYNYNNGIYLWLYLATFGIKFTKKVNENWKKEKIVGLKL